MTTNYWIKLYCELLDDDKMGMLRTPLKWRFIECLLVAGEKGNGGLLPKTTNLAWRLRCDPEKLETDLSELGDTGLLDLVNGQWHVTKFKVRQEPSPTALRMREYRKRKKEAKKEKELETDTGTDPDTYRASRTLRNGGVTPNKLPPVPEYLADPEFLNIWGEWKQHRQDKGSPITWSAATRQYEQFRQWGLPHSIKVMENSMTHGYTGLIEPKGHSANGQAAEPAGFAAGRKILEDIKNGRT